MSYTKGTWNTGEQIRDHKLACSVINLYGTEDEVFDPEHLEELRNFVLNRSISTRDEILSSQGESAAARGSLTGLLISRYGTDDPAFDDRDWELLEDWFKKGNPPGEHVSR